VKKKFSSHSAEPVSKLILGSQDFTRSDKEDQTTGMSILWKLFKSTSTITKTGEN